LKDVALVDILNPSHVFVFHSVDIKEMNHLHWIYIWMYANCLNQAIDVIDILLAIVLLHLIEHAIAIVLGVASNKEDSSSNLADSSLHKQHKKPEDHVVLVLSATVVKDQVQLFRCSRRLGVVFRDQAFQLQLLPEHTCYVVTSLFRLEDP
jgi:hypothetical protein